VTADLNSLPADVDALRELIGEQHNEIIKKYDENEKQRNEIIRLSEQVLLLKRKLYGRKSEKLNQIEDVQDDLFFNEAESHADEKTDEKPAAIGVKGYSRKKPGRKPFPEDWPREEFIHDLPEDEKVCKCGRPMERIGQKITERLDIIPPKVTVEKHIQYTYKCDNCTKTGDAEHPTVKTAPAPPQLIPKSIATAGFLAWIFTAKFCDSMPFYRQEGFFRRFGFHIIRSTMCNLAVQTARTCSILSRFLWEELLSGPVIGIDETTLQVLKEPNRPPTAKSFMWVFRGGTSEKPVVYYEYRQSRSGKFLGERLKDYRGTVMTDGLGSYDVLDEIEYVIHVQCWAHTRRKFVEAQTVADGPSGADEVLELIGQLYAVEEYARTNNFSFEEIQKLRWEQSRPVIRQLRKWLKENRYTVTPKSRLGKAINYTIKRWKKLLRFIRDGRIPIDNNRVENDIRPFCVGRKNWMFNDTPHGAHASAFLYTLIHTAIANEHEPYQYLRFLFELFPLAQSEYEIRELLPGSVSPEEVAEFLDLDVRN
jgi:transposase